MTAMLRYTYLAKGKYWRFRHPSVGDKAIAGKPGSAEFMASYGRFLAKICEEPVVKEKRIPAEKPPVNERPMRIYFVTVDGASIKIGITSNLRKRMSSLQTGHSGKLRLLASYPGTRRMEYMIHQDLKEYRLSGEWFKAGPAVDAVMKTLWECAQIGNSAN